MQNTILRIILAACAALLLAATADAAPALHLRLIVTGTAADAEAILTELSAGSSFAVIAGERSADPSRSRWGELDPAEAAALKNKFPKEVGSLREGEVTGVIRMGEDRFGILQRIDLGPFRAGAKAFRAKDYGEAERQLRLHLQANPDAIKARIMLGKILEKRHMPAEAEPEYAEVLRLDPGNREARARLAALARAGVRNGTRAEPEEFPAAAGDPETGDDRSGTEEPSVMPAPEPEPAATDMADKALPERVPLRMIVTKNEAEAKEILNEYRKGKPFFFLAYDRSSDRKSSLAHGDLGEVETASLQPELREELARLQPGKVSRPIRLNESSYAIIQIKNTTYLREVRRALSAGRLKDAQEHLLQHLSLNPDDLSAWMQLAVLYEKGGATDKAEAAYRQALIFTPWAAEPYERLGELMLSKKECLAARETLRTGVHEAGSSPVMDKLIQVVDICLNGARR